MVTGLGLAAPRPSPFGLTTGSIQATATCLNPPTPWPSLKPMPLSMPRKGKQDLFCKVILSVCHYEKNKVGFNNQGSIGRIEGGLLRLQLDNIEPKT